MYYYEGDVIYKKTWYGVRIDFTVDPGEKANFSGHPDNWYPGCDPEVSFEEVHIEDEDGNPVDLGYEFEAKLAQHLLDAIDEEDGKIYTTVISMN